MSVRLSAARLCEARVFGATECTMSSKSSSIVNRLESLVVDISPFNDFNQDQKDEYMKQYETFNELIFKEDTLIGIFRHNLFKQHYDQQLNLKIYDMIMKKADEDAVARQIFTIMKELSASNNFISTFQSKVLKLAKWNQKKNQLEQFVKSQQPPPSQRNS